MGKEMRNGQVVCIVSKPIQTTRLRSISPAMTSGVVEESTIGTPQIGAFTASDSLMNTLSKLTKRNSGCVFFQSTMAGASARDTSAKRLVKLTWMASTLPLGHTTGVTSSST